MFLSSVVSIFSGLEIFILFNSTASEDFCASTGLVLRVFRRIWLLLDGLITGWVLAMLILPIFVRDSWLRETFEIFLALSWSLCMTVKA